MDNQIKYLSLNNNPIENFAVTDKKIEFDTDTENL